MFFSLFIIFVFGFIGGFIFEKINIPKLIWFIFLGILIGPSILGIVDDKLMVISSYLRQIALVIILTRSGLSLDLKTLKKIGRPAILMCFIPACFELIGVTIFAPLLINISYIEALLLGSVLAAVSPAIVVPRMISLKEKKYGMKHYVSELIMAGSSCDDIFVIILFYSFKGIVANQAIGFWNFAQIPLSIVLGIILGFIVVIFLLFIFKKFKINTITQIILLLGCSFGMIALEEALKAYINISAFLGIIILGVVIKKFLPEDATSIQKGYNALWQGFEILLFTLVGCITDLHYIVSKEGIYLVILILIALAFRSMGVIICVVKTNFSWKEKIFIVFSYLPKATVQASIGGIALTEGLSCGVVIITAAVLAILITAPLGALLMDLFYSKLLESNIDT